MSREEFEALRELPNKRITEDIVFSPHRQVGPNLVFEQVVVENDAGYDILLNGTYKPDIPGVSFNFVLQGTGPICRLDVNGTVHGDAGRSHKHDLRSEDDPRRNLPTAVPRTDLEGASVQEIWAELCEQARIEHTGEIILPEGDHP